MLLQVNSAIQSGQPVSLNPDHTHFLFVDDGYRLRYGGADRLRAKLEKKLATPDTGDVMLLCYNGTT